MVSQARFLFVGERPSATAERIGASWQHGGLCATTLHEALRANGYDPAIQEYLNLFLHGPGRFIVNPEALEQLRRTELPIVAMGRRVSRVLRREKLPYAPMVHPAARGPLRRKDLYHSHVGVALQGEFRLPRKDLADVKSKA